MKDVDLIINHLFEVINAFKLPDSPPYQANRGNRLLSPINFKLRTTQLRIETKLGIVLRQEINFKAQNALPKVEVSLKMLQDVLDIINKDLDLTT